MTDTTYNPPVDQLLSLGETDPVSSVEWPDYLALGIGPEHIPELLRMANDEALNEIGQVDRPEDWASIHAVRALGQLRDESTIGPLVELLTTQADHEWIQEELPEVFCMIGPAAIPALAAYLADDSHPVYPRSYASEGLATLAERYPEKRNEVIDAIARAVEKFSGNDPVLNGLMIGNLAHLKATEKLPLIEQAFEAESVDELTISLDDVLVIMGLKEREEKQSIFADFLPPSLAGSPPAVDLFSPPPRGLYSMSTPIKFSGKRISGKGKAKKGKKR